MAFPDVTVEVAFDNDVNEYLYAQTGYTDITPYVRAISGDLRGRRYEMERVEAGSIQMTLDNADGRFTPGKVSSPYYPNVKPARRVRVRGNNLQRMNIATTGSYDHSTKGFQKGNITPQPVLVASDAGLGLSTSHHIEITLPTGSTAQNYWLLMWNSPIEIGRRTAHSVKVWRVSGTEPAGMQLSISTFYYDKDDVMLGTWDTSNWNVPTPATPTLKFNAHTPPVEAAYAWTVLTCTPAGTTTSPVTYAVAEIQTNNTPNLAPNPSGYLDADYWFITGPNESTVDYDGSYVYGTMAAGDNEMFTYVGGVVPGETYTASITGDWNTATTMLLTTDDGQSGTSWTSGQTISLTFEAQSNPQRLSIMHADHSDMADGETIYATALNVQPGTSNPGAYVRGSDDDLLPAWERPKPIFEGWIEAWPVRVSATDAEITVVANDRLARLGKVDLDSTWREAFFADGMELIIPFDDDPVDAGDSVAQIGTWASQIMAQMVEVDWMPTRGDLSTATYVLGVDGPTDQTASEWNPVTGSTVGYFLPIPHSNDYTAPAPPAPKPPSPKPPASTPTYTYKTYTSRFYATWSRTYEGNLGTTWDDSAYMYQGYYDGNRGMTRSLAGFNYSAIKSTLAGATIKSCKVTLRNEHWYYNGGGKVYVGTHNYASKPSTWADATVNQNRKVASCAKDGTVTLELGVTIGNEFKAGTSKGIALGPPPSGLTYYGFFRGATQSGRPYLTITYTKKVRVS